MISSRILPRIDSTERPRLLLAATAFMCVAAGALASRVAGDALLLSALGSAPLPFLYVAGALVTGLGAFACARGATRAGTARVTVAVLAALLAGHLAVFLTLGIAPSGSRVLAYLLADVTGRLPVLLFWALASEAYDAGASRRLFGLIGAAGTAACLPAGLTMGPLARALGTGSLMLVVAALMAGAILSVAALSRSIPPAGTTRIDRGSRALVAATAGSSARLHRTDQFVTMAAVAAVAAIVQTVVDYQFKATFAPLSGSEGLAGIIGDLYALTSCAALLIQILLMHRIMRHGGVLLSLAALPAGLLAVSAGVARFGTPGWVFAAKAVDITLTLTLFGTARHLLYRGIRTESRLQARALAEGVYQPLALGFAGAMLAITIGGLSLRLTAAATIAGCLVWLALTRAAHRSYVSGLLASIQSRRYEADDEPFAGSERAIEASVRETLARGSDDDVVCLVGILPGLGSFGHLPELAGALARRSPKVKRAVLDCLRESGPPRDLSAIERLASHEDPLVRRAALRAASAPGCLPDRAWLGRGAGDPDPGVRAAAAAALLYGYPGDGGDGALETLRAMASSAMQAERLAAAQSLWDVRDATVTPLLSALLDGEDDSVRGAAIEAAARHPDPALVPRLLPFLGSPGMDSAAGDAIVAAGAEALGPIGAYLDTPPGGDPAARRKVPGILATIGDAGGLTLLERLMSDPDPEVRRAGIASCAALVGRQRAPQACYPDLDRIITREARSAASRLRRWKELGDIEETTLARAAVHDLFVEHLRAAFRLLGARIGSVDSVALAERILEGDGEGRSQARELLANVLPDHLMDPILGVLDEWERPLPEASDPGVAVDCLLRDLDSDWVVAGSLHAASLMRLREVAGSVDELLGHRSPVVRETALAALAPLVGSERLEEACRSLAEDADERVRAVARSLLGSGGARD